MKNIIINSLLACSMLMLLVTNSNAQENDKLKEDFRVVVELHSGTIVEGEVIEWKPTEYIKLKTSFQESLTFQSEDIKKVVQKTALSTAKVKVYNFKEKGVYYAFRGMFITGNDGSRANSVNGFGISASAGYRFNRMIGLGIGVGYDEYIWNSGEQLFPIFAEINGFFTPQLTTTFYNLQLGYSHAFKDDKFLITSAKGGWMVYPSVGVRFGAANTKFTLDLGYKFQKAQFTYRNAWTTTTFSEQDLTYKRLTLRFGVII